MGPATLDHTTLRSKTKLLCRWFAFFALLLAGCGTADNNLRPKVNVITPVEGARFELGETIALRVAAASSNRIVRVELRVAGQTVLDRTNPEPSVTWSTELQFSPSQTGTYALSVVAVDGSGNNSDPFGLNITVGSDIQSLVPPPTEPAKATSTPAPGVIGANGCELSAQFVADATSAPLSMLDRIATVSASVPHASLRLAPTLVGAILAGIASAAFVRASA